MCFLFDFFDSGKSTSGFIDQHEKLLPLLTKLLECKQHKNDNERNWKPKPESLCPEEATTKKLKKFLLNGNASYSVVARLVCVFPVEKCNARAVERT